MIDQLISCARLCDWTETERLLYEHWSTSCPQLYAAHLDQPWDVRIDDDQISKVLLHPLAALYTLDSSTPTDDVRALAGVDGHPLVRGDGRRPGAICGHVFRNGEPTYSCRWTSMRDNKMHTSLQMHASGGTGYCDCGDVEAWREDYACTLHAPEEPSASAQHPATSGESSRDKSIESRLHSLTVILLRYATHVICWKGSDNLPPPLSRGANANCPYHTMLFNDETHTYESVIHALKLAIDCTEQQAMLLATIVDREGRSTVRVGARESCEKVKSDIQRKTARDSNRRTEKSGPLEVRVMDSSLVAYQIWALRLINWLTTQTQNYPPLAEVIGEVLLHEHARELPDMTRESRPSDGIARKCDEQSLAATIMINDRQLWKAARSGFHQMFMATVLMHTEQKLEFARQFVRLYSRLFDDYIDDDHEHSASIVALTVQMFTVPTIARVMIADELAIDVILKALLTHCTKYVHGASGHFNFSPMKVFPAVLKRALSMMHDVSYLLTTLPPPGEWTTGLREGMRRGSESFIAFLENIQGMDAVKRQTGEHQLYETEWETAFNIQLRIQNIITLFLAWIVSDMDLHRAVFMHCLKRVAHYCRVAEFARTVTVTVGSHSTQSIDFDVASAPVSVHIPIWRFFAAFFTAPSAFLGTADSFVHRISRELGDGLPVAGELIEMPLRVLVLCAQSQAQMWRRNGFSLINQIHNYFSPLCRAEMYDRDILMMQVGAALSDPDSFLLIVLHRFGLDKWADACFEETRGGTHTTASTSDEPSKVVVALAEEMLHLFIVIIGERYVPGVGEATREQMLQREVIHVLSTGPKTFSRIEKHIPDDALVDKLSLEDAVHVVSEFRQPTQTSPGLFYLKPALRDQYNPFFYHYSKSDFSQAEQCQQKERPKDQRALFACPPPTPPRFATFFAAIPNLLRCATMIDLLKVVLDRSTRRSRYSSDGLLHRTLYLIGMGLNEQMRDVNAFDFLAVVEKAGIGDALQRLAGQTEAQAHEDLLWWTLQRYKELRNAVMGDGRDRVKTDEDATSAQSTPSVDRESQRAAIAAHKRKQAMEKMARMQRQFITQNKFLLEVGDDGPGDGYNETGQQNDEEEMIGTLVEGSGFPVALGASRSAIAPMSAVRRFTCILCQETAQLNFASGIGVVCAAFVQRSRLFGDSRVTLPQYGELFVPANVPVGLEASTCAHTMHAECYNQFVESMIVRERGRGSRQQLLSRIYDIEQGEYLCPLCKRLSNTAMPVLPALQLLPASVKRTSENHRPGEATSFERWIESIRELVVRPSVGSRQAATNAQGKSHSRKRSHSERSLLDLAKKTDSGTVADNAPFATSVSSASSAIALYSPSGNSDMEMIDMDDEMSLQSTGQLETAESPLPLPSSPLQSSDANTSGTNTPTPSTTETAHWSDTHFAIAAFSPFTSASLLPAMPHAQQLVALFKNMLKKPHKENVPPCIHEWETVKSFAKFLVITQQTSDVPIAAKMWSHPLAIWQTTAFVLRSLTAQLKIEKKPLFGAFNTRQRECFYSLSRLSAMAAFSTRPSVLRHLAARLLHPLVAENGETSLQQRLSEPPIASITAVLPIVTQASHHSSSSSLSASSSSTQKASSHSLDINIVHIDMLTLAIQLMMCIGWTWVDGRQMLHNGPEEGHLIVDGSHDEQHALRLALIAHVFQVVATVEVNEGECHAISTTSESTAISSAEFSMIRHLLARARGGQSSIAVTDCTLHIVRERVRSAITGFLRPIALLYHALTLVPPPEALKDPSCEELQPLCRYLGLPENLSDLLDCDIVSPLFQSWAGHLPMSAIAIVTQPIAVRQLVELPRDFSELINQAAHFRCPSMQLDELTSSVPTLCLVCGVMLCSQSYCCQRKVNKRALGACTYHMQSCSGINGIFLRVRDNQIIMLTSHYRGCFKPTPYVDEFGETDVGFRRGKPLHLNRELYAKLEHLWLHQGIAEEVVNQYEIDHHNIAFEWQHF